MGPDTTAILERLEALATMQGESPALRGDAIRALAADAQMAGQPEVAVLLRTMARRGDADVAALAAFARQVMGQRDPRTRLVRSMYADP